MKLVFSTEDRVVANIIKNELDNHEIENVLMDKRDSVYNTFGYIEVYVLENNLTKAKELIDAVIVQDTNE
ncbi:putative signal transducing protein [Membranihabitans marinus]|uniref:putative signal transducing protein n=1 Tax=Membranihabitans marinus TaxID=1227546 RepID=UPI001F47ACE6|nr:DUF2007 domain-containing protein [Membranihabitans marinus]